MLKWQKKYAGCYVTKCGRFKAQVVSQPCGFGSTFRTWELSTTDPRFDRYCSSLTVCKDGDLCYNNFYDTLKLAKYVAELMQGKRPMPESLTTSGA